MVDPRTTNLADIVVNYATKVQPGDWVLVNGNTVALPLVDQVVKKVTKAGGNTNILLVDDQIQETKLRYATQEQLEWVSPVSRLINEKVDVFIHLRATDNTRALSGIDPKKQQTVAAAHQEISKIFQERSASKDLRWSLTVFPCPAYAQEAEMSLREYEDFVYAATFADQDDATGAWQKVFDQQQRLVDWLVGKKHVEVKGPHVDLHMSIEGRTFINDATGENVPGGEIFTSPVEDSINGRIRFTFPAITQGRSVEGIELEFEDGRVISARADKSEDFLLAMLDTDRGARYVGEFAIGTNYSIQKFTRNILFDEKIGGTMHLAVGRGFLETGGINQSAIHWDMITDMQEDSEIVVDGELFYRNGKFQV
jgi:aminopeptidase